MELSPSKGITDCDTPRARKRPLTDYRSNTIILRNHQNNDMAATYGTYRSIIGQVLDQFISCNRTLSQFLAHMQFLHQLQIIESRNP